MTGAARIEQHVGEQAHDQGGIGCLDQLAGCRAQLRQLGPQQNRVFEQPVIQTHAVPHPGRLAMEVRQVLPLLAYAVFLQQEFAHRLAQITVQLLIAFQRHAFEQELFGIPGKIDIHLPEIALLAALLRDGAAQPQGVGLAQAQAPCNGLGIGHAGTLQLLAKSIHRGGIAEQPGAVGDLVMGRQQGKAAVILAEPVLGGQPEQAEAVQHGTEVELLLRQGPGSEVALVGCEQVELEGITPGLLQGAGQLQPIIALAFE